MSPDSPEPSRQRRAWRAMSAAGCLLAAASILLTAVKWSTTDTRVDRNAEAGQKAICAIVDYAESQAVIVMRGVPGRPGNPRAAASLLKLAGDMRKTGIHCPPRRRVVP